MTAKEAVLKALKPRRWMNTWDLMEAAGYRDATRRVRELRAEGYEIKTRRNADNTYDYRLVGYPQS